MLAQKSAAQGSALGELLLADLYKKGRGTAVSPENASYWYTRGQEQQWVDSLVRPSGGLGKTLLEFFTAVTPQTIASLEGRILQASENCYQGSRHVTGACGELSGLQYDLSNARQALSRNIQDLQETQARLKKDCKEGIRGACDELEEVKQELDELH